MGVLTKFKLLNRSNRNVNIKELTLEEKYMYINNIIVSNSDYNLLLDVIDSLPKEDQSGIAMGIIKYHCDSTKMDFVSTLMDKYLTLDQLKEFLFQYDVSNYTDFSVTAFEKIYDKLSKEEMEYILRAPYTAYSKKEDILKLLINNNISIDFLFEREEYDKGLLEDYNILLPPEKVVQFFIKHKNVEVPSYTRISEEDLIYLKIIEKCKVDICVSNESVIKFFSKYYKEILEKKDEIKFELLGSFIYVGDLDEKIDELELSDEIKSELKELLKREEKKYDFLYHYSDEEIVEYLQNLSDDELLDLFKDKNGYYLRNIAKLPDEKQKHIIELDNSMINYVSHDIALFVIENKLINVTNGMLKSLFHLGTFSAEELYKYYIFNSEQDYIDCLDSFKFSRFNSSLNVINELATKLIEFKSNYRFKLYELDIQEAANNYPNILEIIDFSAFYIDKLLPIYDACKDNKEYLKIILRQSIKNETYERDLIKFLELSTLEEINNSEHSSIWGDAYHLLMDGKLSDDLTIKVYSSNNIIGRFEHVNKDNEQKYIQLLNRIDPSGKLLSLYNHININSFQKSFNGKVNINPDYELLNAKNSFVLNAMTIKNNIDGLLELYKRNPNLLFTFNYKLLDLLDWEDILFYSKYSDLKRIDINRLIEDKEQIKEYINYIKKNVSNSREEVYLLLYVLSNMYDDERKRYLKTFDVNDTLYFISEKPLFISKNAHTDLLERVKKSEEEKEKEILDKEGISKEEILDLICTKIIGTSYGSAEFIISELGSDLYVLLQGNISEEEREYVEKLMTLKNLMIIEDVQLLKNEYIEKYKSLKTPPYIEVLRIKEVIQKLYTKEKMGKLYKPDKKDLKSKTNGTDIYELPNDFTLLLSVVGAYVRGSKLKGNSYDVWNDVYKNSNQNICTSLINQSNLSMAPHRDNAIFGFCNIKEDDIVGEAPYDLGSDSDNIVVRTGRSYQYRTSDNMANNTRHGHSELLLQRFEENDKRQPDYIIAIDRVRPRDIKYAKDFNVPIVVMNTQKIIKYNLGKINALINELNDNVDINKISELILLYNNNYTGFISLNKLAIMRYFRPINISAYLLDYAKTIISSGDKELIEAYIRILKHEQSKYWSVSAEYMPYDFNIIINYLENGLKEEMKETVSEIKK